MKFGINTLLWTSGFDRKHFDLLPRIKEWGFDAVEVACFDWVRFPAAAVRREAEKNGLDVLGCTVMPGVSLIHSLPLKRELAVKYLEHAIGRTAEMGAKILAGPCYSPVGYHTGKRPTEQEWKRQVEGLQRVSRSLDRHGVDLAIEPLNRFETHFLNTAADGARLCGEVGHPRVGILYDTFHANIEEKSQAKAIAAAAPYLKHVHSCENDRGAPGSGHVEWRQVMRALRRANYDGYLTIESFGFAIPEIIKAACIWRDLAPTPDHIAFEGLRFLKSL
jgi:D-psicose/D-tagatose/L-ribulose 3-epimerase